MKRNVLFFSMFAAVILLFAACTPETGMTELGYDDIEASWVDGRWTGTMTTTVDDKEPEVKNVDQTFTEAIVKAFWNSDGGLSIGSLGVKTECNVYVNFNKTKMNIVQRTKTQIGDKISNITIRYELTKQKS